MAWFVAVIIGCVILWFVADLSWQKNVVFSKPKPDAIATSSVADGNILIRNETAGYRITVPETWYLEKSAGSGMTIYPDRATTSSSSLGCKIEISMFTNAVGTDISSWLTTYLHRDPTADILESSREKISVHSVPAMIWNGDMNGVSTTLGYIASGTKVYEIAPSVISGAGDGLSSDKQCANDLRIVFDGFTLTKP